MMIIANLAELRRIEEFLRPNNLNPKEGFLVNRLSHPKGSSQFPRLDWGRNNFTGING